MRLTRTLHSVTNRISLALVLHNHQPVGNFGWVIAETYERAYLPMVEALERHPGIRVGLHYSGPLLEWIRAERPGFLDRLAALVGRDQVELLGGGYYEPVLASLPERDRIDQLVRMASRSSGSAAAGRPGSGWPSASGSPPCRPRSSMPATAGRSSTTPISGRRDSATRRCGARTSPTTRAACLTVFGSHTRLRYGIPFGSVDEIVEPARDERDRGRRSARR